MDSRIKKFAVAVIAISAILFVNFILLKWIFPANNQDKNGSALLVAATDTATFTVQPGLTQTNGPSPTPLALRDLGGACVHTALFWSTNPGSWPAQVTIGDITVSKEGFLTAYKAAKDDAASSVLVQLTAAFLNTNNGTSASSISNTIASAVDWLKIHPVGSEISSHDEQAGAAFAAGLSDYNNGRLDIGLCNGEPTTAAILQTSLPAVTTAATVIGVQRLTLAPTTNQVFFTPRPARTRTPTITHTAVRPTSTVIIPTQTLAPAPTATTIPPTPAPTLPPPPPTATQVSLPTPAPTLTPTP